LPNCHWCFDTYFMHGCIQMIQRNFHPLTSCRNVAADTGNLQVNWTGLWHHSKCQISTKGVDKSTSNLTSRQVWEILVMVDKQQCILPWQRFCCH
jgi:hypothetical protein